MRGAMPTWGRHWGWLSLGLAALGATLGTFLHHEHQALTRTETDRLIKQTQVVEDNLRRQLRAIDLAVRYINKEMPAWSAQNDGYERGIHRLQSMETTMPAVRGFWVMNAAGTVTVANEAAFIGRNFGTRDYFLTPREVADPDKLYVSPPYTGASRTQVINLSRLLDAPPGQFAGIATAAVDPSDMLILLNSVRYSDDMATTLVHGSGLVFVHAPVGNPPPTPGAPGSPLARHLAQPQMVSAQTTPQRLAVLRTLQPADLAMDQPLIICASRELEALYAPWWQEVQMTLLAYLALAGLSILARGLYLRQQAHQRAADQRLKLATEATGIGIWEMDLLNHHYIWDPTMYPLLGLAPDPQDPGNRRWRTLLLPGEMARIRTATRRSLKEGVPFDLSFQIRRPDGQVRWLRNRAAVHQGRGRRAQRLIGTTEDVTERRQREAELRIAAIAFECQEGLIVTDAHERILRVNHTFAEIFGYTPDEVIGQTPRLLQSGRHDEAFYNALWAELSTRGRWQGELWNRRKSGEVFPEWVTITAVTGEDGQVSHYVATHTDITLRKAAEDEIRHLAFYDPLTRLPNRRLLQDRLRQALAQARRQSTQLALLCMDLDHFKPVNDSWGHPAGDELLQAVAQRLTACVRESDTVARLGGDEFVVLLPDIHQEDDALEVAGKILSTLRQPFMLSVGARVQVSVSIGIALHPRHGLDDQALFSHADQALYQAKAQGRDTLALYDPDPACPF